MERNAIVVKVREFIADGDTELEFTDNDNLFDVGLFDSVRVVNLVLFIETTFQITLEFEDLTESNLSTVDAIANLIDRKLVELPT